MRYAKRSVGWFIVHRCDIRTRSQLISMSSLASSLPFPVNSFGNKALEQVIWVRRKMILEGPASSRNEVDSQINT